MTSNNPEFSDALQRPHKRCPTFTCQQELIHFIHMHNNDTSSGLVTVLIGTGFGYYASKVVRCCGLMIGVGILGLEALSRLRWATIDWHTVSNEFVARSGLVTGSSLGPFSWSWSRRAFVAGLLMGFSLENLSRSNNQNLNTSS